MMKRALGLGLSAMLLAACQAGETPPQQTPEALAQAMVGAFETAPGDPDNNFIDRRQIIDLGGDSAWVYLQLNSGPERKVYRQRVLELITHEDGVLQRAWTLKEPASVVDDDGAPRNVSGLISKDGLDAAFSNSGCEQVWTLGADDAGAWVWEGDVDPDTCIIDSARRGKQIRIGSQSRLTAKTLQQAERGFTLEGELLWGTPEGDFATLYRKDG